MKIKGTELAELAKQLSPEWRIVDEHHLERTFRFEDFATALAFTNEVGALAEQQNHHPDISLGWGRVSVTTWSHDVDGLTRRDFALAAKIDGIGA